MTKFLLAILITITGLKLIADSKALVYKYDAVEFSLQDEEGKKENDQHENSKQDNEDIFYPYYFVHQFWFNTILILPSSPGHHKLYSGFIDKPYTPPDIT